MREENWLAKEFESNRKHLRAVAYRMLGSPSEAEDAVQETWLRLSRSDTAAIDNLGGWLTTVIARICLDLLRARKSRREEPLAPGIPEPVVEPEATDEEALLGDSIGAALLIVLNRLTPAERVAFVLHDMFDFTFEEIARIVGRTPAAARQLASRARRRVRGTEPLPDAEVARRRKIVDAFLAASKAGDIAGLLAVLDPDIVLRADETAIRMGEKAEIRGAAAVAASFRGRAQTAKPALIDGAVGVAVALGGELRVVLRLRFVAAVISGIDVVADPERIRRFDVTMFAA